jgi:hypothetical protein
VLPTQVLVDGQIANSYGVNWLKLPPGTHRVCFTHVEFWTEPPCQNVTLRTGSTTTVTGNFSLRGSVRVITSPALPSQIKVDGNPTDDFSTWTDIPPGSHEVCFGAVIDYDPPPCQTAVVTAGKLTTITGTFRPHRGVAGQSGVGVLRVQTSPRLPAQIVITPSGGSPYLADSYGLNGLELKPGLYTLSFNQVPGYAEPAAEQVSITSGVTTTVTGTFSRRGTLKVITSPNAPGTILVDGVPRNDWSMSTEFPTGYHAVCFGQATGFATAPGCQTVSVAAGADSTVMGVYH